MSALMVRLDRFVCWFFNSSPTTMVIESIEFNRTRTDEHAAHHQATKASVHGTRRKVRRPRSPSQRRARA